MILEMTRVEIIGLKAALHPTVQALQSLGCMQINEIESASEPGIRKLVIDEQTLHDQEEPGFLLTQIEGQLEVLGGPARVVPPQRIPPDLMDQVRAALAQLVPVMQKLAARRGELEAELDLLPRYEMALRKLLPVLPPSARIEGNISTGIFVSRAYADLLDLVSREMFQITGGQGEVVTLDIDEETRAMLMVFPAIYSDQMNAFLGQQDVSRLRLPDAVEESSLDATLVEIQRRLQRIPSEIDALHAEVANLRSAWCEKLTFWQAALADRMAAYRILSAFGETQTTFVIVGWIPTPDVEKTRAALLREVGETVFLRELPITPELKARIPIVLRNPPIARSFEGLVRLRALPRYGEIDPSRLMALFMPVFFGLMLGDIGYGAALLLIALWLMRRFKSGMLRSLLVILAVGSGWSILFGVLFGEFFGTLGEVLGMHALLFDRASPQHLVSLLALTLGVGGAHLTLGLLLGLWEAWSARSRTRLLERGGMLLGLVALFLIAGVLVELLPAGLMTPAVAALVLGVVLLSVPMGWLGILMGPLEFIGLIGSLLSYLRIAAIGLASVYLALVANEIAGLVGSIVVGVLIAALVHALNIALGAFSPSIQSLRLHYVEFFRNFYEGGGRAYAPFRRTLQA